MQPTKVLLVDDHDLFRQGVRNAIEREADIEVVGEAEDGTEALAKARELKPDLILMDINMPRCTGLEAISDIKRELPEVRIIMLTVHDDDESLFEAIKRGAEGFLSKKVRAKALVDSLRGVLQGEPALSRYMAGKIMKEYSRLAEIESGNASSQLTLREQEVLRKISLGMSNKEIAQSLYISENTVKAHVTNILGKLQLRTRAEAAIYARRMGLDNEEDQIVNKTTK